MHIRLLPLIAVLLLFGCNAAAPTVSPGTVTPEHSATPGPIETQESNTPVPTSEPSATSIPSLEIPELPEPSEPSALSLALHNWPYEFEISRDLYVYNEKNFWFSDMLRNVEQADEPVIRDLDELLAMPEDERSDYFDIRTGPEAFVASSSFVRVRSNGKDWQDIFGFDFLDIDLTATIGEDMAHPVTPAYMEGSFDIDTIRESLLDVGYEELETGGIAYFAKGGDYQAGNDETRLALNLMNRVYLDETTMVTSPATDVLINIVESIQGDRQSLADDPAFANLASAMGDPTAAALFSRSMVLQPDSSPQVVYEKPSDWGDLHEWETAGFGLAPSTNGNVIHIYSVYYTDPNAAEQDAQELLQRMDGYRSAVPQTFEGDDFVSRGGWIKPDGTTIEPLEDCDFSAHYTIHEEGSTLTVSCELPEERATLIFVGILGLRDVAFLLP